MLHRLPVFHIADIRAQQRVMSLAQGKGSFLMRAKRQYAAARRMHHQRRRGISPAATQEVSSAVHAAHQRIITAVGDAAIMQQKAVRDAIQRLQRRFIIDEHRGIAAVSAGHHHGRTFLCQQDMQRTVWQKEADILIFRQL